MKTQFRLLVFSIFTALFIHPAFTLADSPPPRRPNTKLAGVNILWISVAIDGNVPNRSTLPMKISRLCSEKLQKAGIEITRDPNLTSFSVAKSKIPALKIHIDVFEVNDNSAYVFHSRTAFSRIVTLAAESGPISDKLDVWESKSIMGSAAKEKFSEAVADAVLRQIDEFAAAWSIVNSTDPNSPAVLLSKRTADKESKPAEKQNPERKVIASKNSDVFHKPGCPFAQNIAPKNIIDYNSREEAIAAGKRPCKKCNP